MFNRGCGAAPIAHLRAPPLASSAGTGPKLALSWSATGADASAFTLQVEQTSSGGHGWRTLLGATTRHSCASAAAYGATYQFRVRAIGASGLTSGWAVATTVIPSATRVPGGRYRGSLAAGARARRVGWARAARVTGASLTLSFVGGDAAADRRRVASGRRGRVSPSTVARARSACTRPGRMRASVVYRAPLAPGRHRLVIRVLGGVVPLEGVAITNRRR